jgi:SPP1 gp7 family putative phage head morphogenesis protein
MKMTITRNEWRAIASKCGVTLKPDDERGDVYLGGLMTVEIPAFQKPEEPEPAPAPAIEEPAKPAEDQETIDLGKAIKELETATKGLDRGDKGLEKEKRITLWKAFDKRATGHEAPFKNAVKMFSKGQRKDIESGLGSVESVKDVDSLVSRVFKSADNDLLSKLKPAWLICLNAGRDHAKEVLNRKADTDAITNEMFAKWIKINGLSKAKGINDVTNKKLLKKLKEELAESIDAGEDIGKRIERLKDVCDGVYDEMDDSRAEKIARTESGTTINAGSYATYKAEGIGKKEWIGVPDDRQREEHTLADGQIVGIDEKFIVDGEELEYPGDPAGSAENIIQCRCTIAPVIEED